MKKLLIAAVATAAIATSAHAGITVDGVLDADYGAPTAHVGFDSGADVGNFGTPSNVSNNVAYDIYLRDEGGVLYGFL
ncbi:hypothetical protein, partial [Phenylobacterium sp.]|uniref:hypothetical protein n=1 Tax=Phenylobacterium sp. TaxID=1871053 RepID=UPI001207EB41